MKAACLIALTGLLAVGTSGGDTVVSVYYYPWYGAAGQHWDLGYAGKKDGRGPLSGEYDSRSPELIGEHLALSRELGINNWVCSWWGPESSEDITLRNHVLPLIATADEKAETPPTFCLFYEAAGLLGLDPAKGIFFDSATINRFAAHFRFIADHYFPHPSYRRIEGRPVVYLYLSRTFSGDYPRALAAVRAIGLARGYELFLVGDEVYWGEPDPERVRLYDAVTAYNMHGPLTYATLADWTPFLADCDAVYTRWRTLATELGVGFIPGVMPGFDSRGVDPTAHYVIPRRLRPGAGPLSTFTAMSAMAKRHLDPALREVAITSFNEWHEGTRIEPAKGDEESAGTVINRIFGE